MSTQTRHGQYSNDTETQFEVFLDEEIARNFAKSLKNAFELIRHTSGTQVWIQNNTNNSKKLM